MSTDQPNQATESGSTDCSEVFKHNWPNGLETRKFYQVFCDDKGAKGGTWLKVFIADDGDVHVAMQDWETIPDGEASSFPSLRVRTGAGGGRNQRARQALLYLAEAIRLDQIDNSSQFPNL